VSARVVDLETVRRRRRNPAPVDVAARLRELATRVDRGEVGSVAVAYVETGQIVGGWVAASDHDPPGLLAGALGGVELRARALVFAAPSADDLDPDAPQW